MTPATPVPNAPLSDGWVAHDGGPNPVPGQTADIQFRDGIVFPSEETDTWEWAHYPERPAPTEDGAADIIAYRLASPAPASSEGGEPDWTAATQAAWDANNAPPAVDGTATGLEVVAWRIKPGSKWVIQETVPSGFVHIPGRVEPLTDHAEASRQLAERDAELADVSALREAIFKVILNEGGVMVAPGEEHDAIRRIIAARDEAEADAATVREARDWSEFEDDLSDVIQDSMDMDWTSRDGAKAVVRWLNERARS